MVSTAVDIGLVVRREGRVVFAGRAGGAAASIELDDATQAAALLSVLEGSPSVVDPEVEDVARQFKAELARRGISPVERDSASERGIDVLFRLEDLGAELLSQHVLGGRYWRTLMAPGPASVPLLIATAIENYHFLAREPLFDSPALWLPEWPAAQVVINDFYVSEFGHDELLLDALEACGYSRREISESCVPLPSTTAFCNALSHWALTEPLFFFATIGFLEGREGRVDSFIEACERTPDLPPGFLEPLRKHATINLRAGHGHVSRALFRRIGALDSQTIRRMESLLPQFAALYGDFYNQIADHVARGAGVRYLHDFGDFARCGVEYRQ